jgi:hypothetical protein
VFPRRSSAPVPAAAFFNKKSWEARAGKIAASVSGVSSVDNKLVVVKGS